MVMSPGVRKLALTAHVISSVGFLGAVAAFFALAVAGLTSQEAPTVRAAYLAMELTAWYVIVPLSLASLVTGLVSSLGTTWGLFRHYWVVVKLLIAVPSAIVLLVHIQPIRLSSADLSEVRVQLAAAAGAALVVLVVATTLSVYKPQGMTRYGWRKQHDEHSAATLVN
jgi:hypothetical protein